MASSDGQVFDATIIPVCRALVKRGENFLNRLGETGRMAQHDGNKQRGWVNYFRVLAGGYLLYLAYQLMKGIWDGTAETVALNAAAGAVFAAAGAMVLWREWKAYQYAKAHKDDPDSWSQDDALPEQKRPATPAEQVGPEADQKGRDEE